MENRGDCVGAPERESGGGNVKMIYAGVHVGQQSSNLLLPALCVCFTLFFLPRALPHSSS